MRRNINRLHPDTCECVIELVHTVDDVLVPGMFIKENEFLMMNNICQKHRHLASQIHKDEHPQLAQNVLDIIAEAKAVNLKQVDDLIANETSNFRKKDLIRCREIVVQFNARLDEEWAELIQPPHAFDSHIHTTVMGEQTLKRLS